MKDGVMMERGVEERLGESLRSVEEEKKKFLGERWKE